MFTSTHETASSCPELPENISHAYIVGTEIAARLAKAVVCAGGEAKPCMACAHCDKASRRIHPDISVLEKLPDKREIIVDQIRELKKDVFVLPNEAAKKAYIISSADIMNTAAQNALLAILEEPPKHVVFILQTENHMALLPTVRSRCVRLSASPAQKDTDEAVETLSRDFISAIQSGNLALAEIMFKIEKLEKPDLISMILRSRENIAEIFAAQTSGGTSNGDSLKRLFKADKMLVDASEYLELNVNKGHVAGLICAGLMA